MPAQSSYTKKATIRKAATSAVAGKGDANNVRVLLQSTVELATATAAGKTVFFGRIPSNARIDYSSRIYWDDLATTGSPTFKLGLGAVDGNITDDDDAFNASLALSAVSTANVGNAVLSDHANAGKQAWEFVSGQATDPGGMLEVYGTTVAAGTTQAGTITLDLKGYFD